MRFVDNGCFNGFLRILCNDLRFIMAFRMLWNPSSCVSESGLNAFVTEAGSVTSFSIVSDFGLLGLIKIGP